MADALVFELMGLAMLALCIVVLAVPSGRAACPAHQRRLTNPASKRRY